MQVFVITTHGPRASPSSILFSTTLLRLHVRAPPSSKSFAAGRRRHGQLMQTEKENIRFRKKNK